MASYIMSLAMVSCLTVAALAAPTPQAATTTPKSGSTTAAPSLEKRSFGLNPSLVGGNNGLQANILPGHHAAGTIGQTGATYPALVGSSLQNILSSTQGLIPQLGVSGFGSGFGQSVSGQTFNNGFNQAQGASGAAQNQGGFNYNKGSSKNNVYSDKHDYANKESFGFSLDSASAAAQGQQSNAQNAHQASQASGAHAEQAGVAVSSANGLTAAIPPVAPIATV